MYQGAGGGAAGAARARPCWCCGGRRRRRRGANPDVDGSLDVRYADGDYERAVRPAALHLLAAAPCCGRGCAAAARVARRGRGEAGAPGASAAAGAGGGPSVIQGAGGSSTRDGSVDSDVLYANCDCCGGAAAARRGRGETAAAPGCHGGAAGVLRYNINVWPVRRSMHANPVKLT